MSLAPPPVVGSVKVVAVGNAAALARGRPAEFRHRGLALVTRPSALAALIEVGREPGSIALVPTDLEDMPLLEFVDVLRSVAHVPVILGIMPGTNSQVVSELYDHGIAVTVALPTTPGRLSEAVLATRAPEPPEELFLELGSLTLDDARHRVTWYGSDVTLAPKSFDILRYMMLSHPRVITLPELMEQVGDGLHDRGVRARSTISRLRAAFADAMPYRPTPLETVHRIGYRLRP